jgi:hypothetical protein
MFLALRYRGSRDLSRIMSVTNYNWIPSRPVLKTHCINYKFWLKLECVHIRIEIRIKLSKTGCKTSAACVAPAQWTGEVSAV